MNLSNIDSSKIRKWIIIISVSFIVVGCIISSTQLIISPRLRTGPFGIGLPARMETFKGTINYFTIDYPESWVVLETPQGNHGEQDVIGVIQVPGRTWPNVFIRQIKIADNKTEELASYGKTKTENLPGYLQIQFHEFQTSNLSGLLRDYSWTSQDPLLGDKMIWCRDYYTIVHGYGYIVTFCVDEERWPEVDKIFKQMIESFSPGI